jgi:hypothetical protein
MPWYQLTKIVHFMGLVSLVCAFMIYPRVGEKLRGATTLRDARGWLGFLDITRGMFHGGAGMTLLSGIVMTGMRWRAPTAFATVGLIALPIIWITFAVVCAPHMRAMHAALGDAEGPVSPAAAAVLNTPRPWIAIVAMNLTAIGVLFEMTLKLDWLGAILLVAAGAILGTVIGSSSMRRKGKPSPA